MGSPPTHSMFRNFTYQKTTEEILEAMTKKVVALKSKITEREARVVHIREEFNITDADMIDLLTQAANEARDNRHTRAKMSYNIDSSEGEVRVIAAGVIENIITEKSYIEQEQKTITQLEMIGRNLKPVDCFGDNGESYVKDHFSLSFDELDFLGF